MKVGDVVIHKHPHGLHCATQVYPHAYVVQVEPLVLVSEDGDMCWSRVEEEELNIHRQATYQEMIKPLERYEREKKNEILDPMYEDIRFVIISFQGSYDESTCTRGCCPSQWVHGDTQTRHFETAEEAARWIISRQSEDEQQDTTHYILSPEDPAIQILDLFYDGQEIDDYCSGDRIYVSEYAKVATEVLDVLEPMKEKIAQEKQRKEEEEKAIAAKKKAEEDARKAKEKEERERKQLEELKARYPDA